MTSSNGNIFRVTGPLCGEFTGPGEFPAQRPVTRSFDVFFDLRLNKRLSKQPWGWWLETPSWSLWRQCNGSLCIDWKYIRTKIMVYRQTSNISRTKSQNLNFSRLDLQSSLSNPLEPCFKSIMKMQLEQRRQGILQLHLSDQEFHCLLRCALYQRFDRRYLYMPYIKHGQTISVKETSGGMYHDNNAMITLRVRRKEGFCL